MVDKAPSGKHRARWRDASGRQRTKSFDRKLDAQRYETKMKASVADGTYVTPSKTTVAEYADRWLAGARNLGTGGQETYRRDLDRYVLPALGGVRLDRLTDEMIDEWLTSEIQAGLAASSVNRHYRTLNRLLNVAVERHVLRTNPCRPVRPPVVKRKEMRFLTPAQVEALAGSIGEHNRAWVHCAAYGGFRWSETVGLRRRNVHGLTVRIEDQLVRRLDGTWDRCEPKSEMGKRAVTLPGFVADELAEHIEARSGPGRDGLVFPNRAGNPMINSSFASQTFKPALERAGLDQAVRIHDLRHTAVSLAIRAGAHPKAIQVRMGHASIMVTLDRYGHLFPEMDPEIATGLNGMLGEVVVGGLVAAGRWITAPPSGRLRVVAA